MFFALSKTTEVFPVMISTPIYLFKMRYSNSRAPIIMHCSAGVGRTGTIIAVDRVMQMFERNLLKKNFNVKDLVIELRKQRMKMVQVQSSLTVIIGINHPILERRTIQISLPHCI
jgi:protein tyrosine phosphatase